MKRVSAVFTVHDEKGLANSSELLAILERTKPDVIFLESPPAAFDDYLNGARRTLEATAATLYRDLHGADLIAVDLPTPEDEFWRNSRYLFERIERTSYEYRRLFDRHSHDVSVHGFEYLNSRRCSESYFKLHAAMRAAIERLVDRQRLAAFYELWNKTNELRDIEMLRNIENYCKQTSSSTGAFLVGAAHRQSIIDKARCQHGANSSAITWDLAGFLETPN